MGYNFISRIIINFVLLKAVSSNNIYSINEHFPQLAKEVIYIVVINKSFWIGITKLLSSIRITVV